jgi:formate dehydrogenase major subunit
VLRARVTDQCNPGVVFIPMHFSEAAANLLTIDALDATAKIPEFKACAVSLALAKEEELVNAEARTQRGRR